MNNLIARFKAHRAKWSGTYTYCQAVIITLLMLYGIAVVIDGGIPNDGDAFNTVPEQHQTN